MINEARDRSKHTAPHADVLELYVVWLKKGVQKKWRTMTGFTALHFRDSREWKSLEADFLRDL